MTKLLSLSLLLGLSIGSLCAATVTYTSGTVGADVTFFVASSGTTLDGGYMRAGTFTTAPGSAVGLNDVLTGFEEFAQLNTGASLSFGYFLDGGFVAPLDQTGSGGIDFASDKIYLVVSDTADLAAASQLAVLSSTNGKWSFQANDTTNHPGIGLPELDEYLLGTPGTIVDPPGAPADEYDSIQMVSVPEPSTLLLSMLGTVLVLRRRR